MNTKMWGFSGALEEAVSEHKLEAYYRTTQRMFLVESFHSESKKTAPSNSSAHRGYSLKNPSSSDFVAHLEKDLCAIQSIDEEKIAALRSAICDRVRERGKNRKFFEEWIASEQARRNSIIQTPGMIAILQAAVELQIEGIPLLIDAILANDKSNGLTTAIAGQVIRREEIIDQKQRKSMGANLQKWISGWIQSCQASDDSETDERQEFAVKTLPSVPYLLDEECFDWMLNIIGTNNVRIAYSAALGLRRWFEGGGAQSCSEPSKAAAMDKIIPRINEILPNAHSWDTDTAHFGAVLLELLGHVSIAGRLQQSVDTFVKAISTDGFFAKNAALKAGRALASRLQNEWRNELPEEMHEKFLKR